MPHTHRSFSDRGIADSLWKRVRWARQNRSLDRFTPTTKKTPNPISASITAAITTFLKGKEDAQRSRRPNDSKHNPQHHALAELQVH